MAFADVDVDVAERRLGKLAPLGSVVWAFGQPGDAMTFQAAVQAGSSELADAIAQGSENVVERQWGAPPELHDRGFLDRGKDGAVQRARPHWRVFGDGSRPPLGHRAAAQPVAFGQGPARLFRCLERGSNSRRRSGAAVKTACQSASSASRVRVAS